MARLPCILAVAGLALILARDAGAVGGVVGSAGQPVTIAEARYALAISAAQTTRWASIEVQKFPGAMAWLVPVRPGARVEEVSDAWFEALELATAPRLVAASCGSVPMPSGARVVSAPDRVPTERSLESTIIEDVPALRAFASQRALEVSPEVEARFDALQARGFSLAAFLYAGPAQGGFTRTVRVTDDAFPSVPLFMTLGMDSPVRVTAFLIGTARARLGAASEIEIDPASVSAAADGATSYEAARIEKLLAANGLGWIVEASERDLFLTGARRPAGIEVTPPIAPTYDARAASYGDLPNDLTLALYGHDPAKVWVTRVAGVVPAHRFGDDVAVTIAAGPSKSPFLQTAQLPPGCVPAVVVPPAEMTVAPPTMTPNPPPTEPHPNPSREPRPVVVETTVVETPPTQVTVSGSCDGSPASDPQDSSSSDDSCSHSDGSSDTSSSDDGCDGSSDTPSSDSADQSGGGCDSSSSDSSSDQSGGGCDSGSSSSSSSSSSDCSVSRRPRRHRSRTSLVAWGICAVLLPLRRAVRKRADGKEC